MRLLIGILLVLFALGGISLRFILSGEHQPKNGKVEINGQTWAIEYARTEEERALGLGGRDSLATGRGMFFLFPASGRYAFWMKGMRFPLDIVFIRDKRIVSVERGILPTDKRTYTPPEAVDTVLEVNAGEADRLEPGMAVIETP